MGMFSLDEQPEYLELENKINMITKVIVNYDDFMNDTEKITLIKQILNNTIKKV